MVDCPVRPVKRNESNATPFTLRIARGAKKMISKTNPDRSKIIIEHEDQIKYWSRHAPSYPQSKRGGVGFVPLDGPDGAIDHSGRGARTQAQGDRRLICQKWHLWVQNTADLASKTEAI